MYGALLYLFAEFEQLKGGLSFMGVVAVRKDPGDSRKVHIDSTLTKLLLLYSHT